MSTSDELNKLVNASGFAFQLGIEHAVRQKKSHSWSVISREHPWALGENSGFIDLVLGGGIATGVVECKRTRDGKWMFLVPNGEDTRRSASRVHWVAGTKDGRPLSGLDTIEHLPPSYVSSFCVVRGTGENDRPLLERLCATLLTSADALAEEEVGILQRKNQGWRGFYLPIVVTTAELHVCRLAPSRVSLTSGNVDEATFESVPFIRFQKAFSTSSEGTEITDDLGASATKRERTVWIVRAENIDNFLGQIRSPPYGESYPWGTALATLEQAT